MKSNWMSKRFYTVLGGMALSLGLISAGISASSMTSEMTASLPGPTRSGGAAAVLGQDRTGSPVGGGNTCSPCHNGGSFSPSVNIEVRDAMNNVVNSYTPGDTYTLEYTVTAGSGSPSGYAMQSLAISPNAGNAGAGTYATINTANSQISSTGGRNYFEQQGLQATGFFSVDWIAPASGFGQVNIFAVGVVANGNGATSGDETSPSVTYSLTEDVPTAIDFPGNPYCSNVANPNPVVVGELGGTFTAPVGLDIDASTGQINIAGSMVGTYTVTYTGATETATFDVTINPIVSTTDVATICANETLQFGGLTLTSADAGLNTAVLQTTTGCDSTVDLTLTVLPTISTSLTETICASQTTTFNGQTLDASNAGLNTATLTSFNGCDSTVELTLIVNAEPTTSLAESICPTGTFNFNGQTLDASNAGLNTATLTGTNGCDSIVELTLTVNTIDTVAISETICPSGTFDFNGQILDSSNVGLNTITLTNANGCDSLVELTLDVTTIDVGVTVGVFMLNANQPNATYQWLDCENNFAPVAGETNQVFNNIFTFGIYAVELTVGNCTDTSDCYIPDAQGIDEKTSTLIQVYPTPATDVLKIKNLNDLTDVTSMAIINTLGQQIWSQSSSSEEIQVSQLPSGSYFLKVQHAQGTELVKFIKR